MAGLGEEGAEKIRLSILLASGEKFRGLVRRP